MVVSIKEMASRRKSLIIAYKIYRNWQAKRRLQSGNHCSALGSTYSRLTLEESLNRINDQFDDYLAYGGLTEHSLRGKKVLEIGFGDNIGVALRLLIAGAAKVVCLDKFYSLEDNEQQQRIYLALRKTLGLVERRRFDEAISFIEGMRVNPKKLERIYGTGVEKLSEAVKPEAFDLIVSRTVLQDVFYPAVAFAEMEKALAPGGVMLHRIDLSDQGMFRDKGMHPLTFMTIPQSLYRLMASDSASSNRKTISCYRSLLSRIGLDGRIIITSLLGSRRESGNTLGSETRFDSLRFEQETARSLVREIRPRLAPEFWGLSDEELMVDGIFLTARKPRRAERQPALRLVQKPAAMRPLLHVVGKNLTGQAIQGQLR